jgi:hypothetical protein
MPLRDGRRPLKRWCYAGIYGAELMMCAGAVAVAGVPQSFWAVWDRERDAIEGETLLTRTRRVKVSPSRVQVRSGPARLELTISPVGQAVEVVSPHGDSYIWTRKTPVRADGHFALDMEVRPVSGFGLVDESAGYHARHTAWEWSAGVGTSAAGDPLIWNLVAGVHDARVMSERTVWVGGMPEEVPAVHFSRELDAISGDDGTTLHFDEEASRRRRDNLGVVRSNYVQPFGTFRGTLPGGIALDPQTPGLGVMERHEATW